MVGDKIMITWKEKASMWGMKVAMAVVVGIATVAKPAMNIVLDYKERWRNTGEENDFFARLRNVFDDADIPLSNIKTLNEISATTKKPVVCIMCGKNKELCDCSAKDEMDEITKLINDRKLSNSSEERAVRLEKDMQKVEQHPCMKCQCPVDIMKIYGGYNKHWCGPCNAVLQDNSQETLNVLKTNPFASKCGKSGWHIYDPNNQRHENSLKQSWYGQDPTPMVKIETDTVFVADKQLFKETGEKVKNEQGDVFEVMQPYTPTVGGKTNIYQPTVGGKTNIYQPTVGSNREPKNSQEERAARLERDMQVELTAIEAGKKQKEVVAFAELMAKKGLCRDDFFSIQIQVAEINKWNDDTIYAMKKYVNALPNKTYSDPKAELQVSMNDLVADMGGETDNISMKDIKKAAKQAGKKTKAVDIANDMVANSHCSISGRAFSNQVEKIMGWSEEKINSAWQPLVAKQANKKKPANRKSSPANSGVGKNSRKPSTKTTKVKK